MILDDSPLVSLILLVDKIPTPPPKPPGRGRPVVYPNLLFLKALILMTVRQLHQVHQLLSVLEEPTREMQQLKRLLTHDGRFPTRVVLNM